MGKPENIILDLGGVLLNIDYSRTITAFNQLGVIDNNFFYSKEKQSPLFDSFEIGAITTEEFISILKKKLSIATNDDLIIDAWNAMLLDFPDRRWRLLAELNENFNLYLFSNTNEIHESAFNKIISNSFGSSSLDKWFKGYHLSHKFGYRKPNKQAFTKLLEINNLKAKDCIFVDDSAQHVEGAKLVGIKSFLLDKNEELEELLRKEGII
ncbi:MAG: HAD-IA family hydrolase [Luteibaculaceae bacterium]